MKKDVIYIDTEDDITSIIEKVKASTEKIIALVPPKRVGVLQSAVNLKLLHKAASGVNRHLVLITNDKALSTLAAGVQIPVAKTLQSRPELANTDGAPDMDQEEVINGDELPVGELQKSAKPLPPSSDDEEIILPDNLIGEAPKSVAPAKKSAKKGPKIPNFDSFRKKLFLIGAGVVLIILFLIWATIFAPHAEVNIRAKTSSVDVALPVTLNSNATLDPAKAVIKPLTQQIKKTNSADFPATGKKDVGDRASGSATISNCSDSDPITIPAGTALSSDGLNFITASAVTVPGLKVKAGQCLPGQASVAVSAQDVGEQYNLKKSSLFTVAGQSSEVSASNPNAFTGGSKRQATVISDADVAAAQQKITSQDQNPVRAELTSKFDTTVVVVTDSFAVAPGAPSVAPAVGTEVASGRITIETTYTLFAISKADAAEVLEAFLTTKFKTEKSQKIYDNGLKKLQLAKFTPADGGGSVQFVTKGYIGPTIDAEKLKAGLVGKNYEEIRQKIQAVDGVDDVDTKFSPFWVSRVNDVKKIDIKFTVSQK